MRGEWSGAVASFPGVILGGILTATIAWSVSHYLPRLVERVENPEPMRFTLFTNPGEIDTFSDDTQVALIPPGRKVSGSPGPGCRGFHTWLKEYGGADVGTTKLRVILRGSATSPVVVERMRARVVDRRRPGGGIPIECPSAGAAAVRSVAIDLDSPDALAHYVTLNGTKPLAFTLARDESEIFDLRVSTRECHCRWVLDIGFVANGKPDTLTIMDAGEPFETTAPRRKSPVYTWDYTSSWLLSRGDGFQEKNVPTSSLRALW